MQDKLIYCHSTPNVRTCILVGKDIPVNHSFPLMDCYSRNIMMVQVSWCNRGEKINVIISSVYIPFDIRTLSPTWELKLIVKHCPVDARRLLTGSDVNSHHEAGC